MSRPDIDSIKATLVLCEKKDLCLSVHPTTMRALLDYVAELEEEQAKDRERQANWLAAVGDCGP